MDKSRVYTVNNYRYTCEFPLKIIDISGKFAMIYKDARNTPHWQPAASRRSVTMINREVIVRCESGLHNRQATYFVQKANEFESSIQLESGNRRMNAKSLLGIMSLSIVTGATVTLYADGSDEGDALNALEALLQRDVY